jgi:drug/metabolite transporter (DMT)-like permease
MKAPNWLIPAILAPLFWGVWGALTEIPEKWISPPFPPTLGYVVWSFTMVPVAAFVLFKVNWRLERTRPAIAYGFAVGLTGAVGQLLLFHVLNQGPAFIIFPIVCLSPVVTIVLSATLLRERTRALGAAGIFLAMPAIFLLSLQEKTDASFHGHLWLLWTICIFVVWGLQAYFMKSSSQHISSEGLFFYMSVAALLVSPFAILMTSFNKPINWGWKGPGLTALIQGLNAIGALLFVYAVRYGKAIIVVPMVNGVYPLVTILLSLAIYHSIPSRYNLAGMALAIVSVFVMALDEVRSPTQLSDSAAAS